MQVARESSPWIAIETVDDRALTMQHALIASLSLALSLSLSLSLSIYIYDSLALTLSFSHPLGLSLCLYTPPKAMSVLHQFIV